MSESTSILTSNDETRVGTYFVSNYPPYSYWTASAADEAAAALDRPPVTDVPLGVYLHIPFCRRRCRFCYFRVYTDKNAAEINRYLDAAIEELTLYSKKPVAAGRKPRFVYFGGGTPSMLSTEQLGRLVGSMKELFPWDEAQEVAFECEPGTITEHKVEFLAETGVTRLSLGIENFNQEILELNNRAHGAAEIDRAYGFARKVGFPQINIDLIAGMVGETEENWQACIQKTIEMQPDSITIYQMEVPPNTTISKEMRTSGESVAPVADWATKRRWVAEAFASLEAAGYTITSAYTAVKNPERTKFLYRDLLWQGADMLGLGVASFSHVNGVHYQNEHHIEPYIESVQRGELPIRRALTPNAEERMIRELILQMKLGRVRRGYFQDKFGVDIQERFASQLESLAAHGYAAVDADGVRLSRDGLLQVDRLLHGFFLPQHRESRAA